MAGASGPKARLMKARHSTSAFRRRDTMDSLQTLNEVEVLLVEDNPSDAELTMRALRKRNLANKLFHAKDGAEALDFVFAQGQFLDRRIENGPKVVLLDLKLPKVDGL